MNIANRKIEFIKNFLKIENEDSVIRFEKLLNVEMANNSFKAMSQEEFFARIDKSIEDSNNGNITHIDDLIKEIEEWS